MRPRFIPPPVSVSLTRRLYSDRAAGATLATMRAALVLVAALAVTAAAFAADGDLLAVKVRYLAPAQARFASDPEALQARYDAGRDLEEAVRGVDASRRCAGLRAALLRFARAQVAT